MQTPDTITIDLPSRWHRSQPAQMVIVSHPRFLASARVLASHRAREGLSVSVVDIRDLYDEYSFGRKTPHAIRDFASHCAQRWGAAPEYLLLLGDATYDPRDHLASGLEDLVPTKWIDTAALQTASDDWFGDLDSDGVAEIAVGRLPVRTVTEADRVIAKIIDYDPWAPGWADEVLLIADDRDGYDYDAACHALASLFPPTTTTRILSLDFLSPDSLRHQLHARLDQGPRVVIYCGHGGTGTWATERVFTVDSAVALRNRDRLPVVGVASCLSGYFEHLGGDSMAEALLKAERGGAVAVWASSGVTSPSEQLTLQRNWLLALQGDPRTTLGEAIRTAKATIQNTDVRRTWILFGDPATRPALGP